MHRIIHLAAISAAIALCVPVAHAQPGGLDSGVFGLYDAAELRAVDGRCPDCTTPKQALWYFQGDLVAMPKTTQAQSTSFSRLSVAEDVRAWSHSHRAAPRTLPFMSWLGSPELVEGATLDASGTLLKLSSAQGIGFAVVPKIASNRSYFNGDTVSFFPSATSACAASHRPAIPASRASSRV
jgi:hypothetical protein